MKMRRLVQSFCLGAALVAASTNAQANGLACNGISREIKDTDLRFALSHSQIPGQLAVTTHTLRVEGRHYKLESSSKAQGLLALLYSGQLTQRSEGLIDPRLGLTPLYYAEKRGKRPLQETAVRPDEQQVLFKKDGTVAEYETGLQDRLSMIYQISARLRCNPKLDAGQALPVRVMTTGRLGTEPFVVKGSETLELSIDGKNQKVNALQLETTPEFEGDDIVRVWFAQSLSWLPVQIQIQDKEGKSMTQTLIGQGKAQ